MNESVDGLILAGGQGTRMGGVDKGLQLVNGAPMVMHVANAMTTQVETLYVSANRSVDEYAAFGWHVIADRVPGFIGPLGGIHAALCASNAAWLMIAPCDVPAIAPSVFEALVDRARRGAMDIVYAADEQRAHPVVAVVKTSLAQDLESYLLKGERKILPWYECHDAERMVFSRAECFQNVNTPEDKALVERIMSTELKKTH
ncbi:molybdenum cofactor guanylyltransferase MobA [Larsenimonas salina]|uniref:molybdenum cofactor guanylyltransferase MobA n=1 Tax=Larsenimonas salina TaxID=1295565 RepID=UPI00207475A6|nr:molybdenum cofactor guanylyltransferase MobA [Larsenimonas salina]MCM5703675.1 molybdenum cofactor guanylyltransferase [Larsenimonas salina]